MTGEEVVLDGRGTVGDLAALVIVSLLAIWANRYFEYMYAEEVAMYYFGSPYTPLVMFYACVRGVSVWCVRSLYIRPDLVVAKSLLFREPKQLGTIQFVSDGIRIGRQSELVMLKFDNGRTNCVVFPPEGIRQMRSLFKME